MRGVISCLGFIAACFIMQPATAQKQTKPVALQGDPAAIANDDQAFDRFLKTLPTVTVPGPPLRTFYLWEGDIRMTAAQVRAALQTQAPPSTSTSAGELKVMVQGGQTIIWPKGKRALEYSVDRASFGSQARYNTVVQAVKEAAAAWVDACPTCGLSFTHRSEYDSNPDIRGVTFVVAYQPDATNYIAMAFFPNEEQELHYVWIAPSFFDPGQVPSVGVLRHELGHVLGYRHEHIGGIPGCNAEDNDWKAVTSYDPSSVMHYFCGNGGIFELNLSAKDKEGHAATYK